MKLLNILIILIVISTGRTRAEACSAVFQKTLTSSELISTLNSPAMLSDLIELSHPVLGKQDVLYVSEINWIELMMQLSESGKLEELFKSATERQSYLIIASIQTLNLPLDLNIKDTLGLNKQTPQSLRAYFRFWKALELHLGRAISAKAFATVLLWKTGDTISLARLNELGFSNSEITILNNLSF